MCSAFSCAGMRLVPGLGGGKMYEEVLGYGGLRLLRRLSAMGGRRRPSWWRSAGVETDSVHSAIDSAGLGVARFLGECIRIEEDLWRRQEGRRRRGGGQWHGSGDSLVGRARGL